MLKNLSITRKGLLVILFPILCQTVLLGLIYHWQGEQAEAQRWAVHTKDVLLRIDQLVSATLQVQASLLGYAVTGNEIYAEEEKRVLERVDPLSQQLMDIVADNPTQVERAAAIRVAVQKRIEWNREVGGLIRSGRQAEAQRKFQELEGKKLIDSLLAQVEAFRLTEEQLDTQRLERLDQSSTFQNRLLVVGVLVTLLIGIAAALLLSSGLTSRIAVLRENSRRFMRGERLAAAVPGRDEIGELDRNFHEMAETILEARQAEHDFQATLEKQNVELTNANRDLDHKNRENEMFVYSVSHDLRSPLVNLQGFSKELGTARDSLKVMLQSDLDAAARQRADRIIDRDVSESIRYIQASVMRLSAIIDALLRLSRAGRIEYKGESVPLDKIMTRIVEAMRSQIQAKGVELKLGELPTLFGDPTALEQIFANLIGNAVNYLDPSRPGVIEISEVANPEGDLEGMQVVAVKDNGLGISEAYLPKVFTIFQRLHGNIAPGEGIGLALVRRMVERHGGRIWVESKDKEGSTFYVALPPKEKSVLVVAPKKESVRVAHLTPARATS